MTWKGLGTGDGGPGYRTQTPVRTTSPGGHRAIEVLSSNDPDPIVTIGPTTRSILEIIGPGGPTGTLRSLVPRCAFLPSKTCPLCEKNPEVLLRSVNFE